MKKQIRKITSGLLAVGILMGGFTSGIHAFAANEGVGSAGALADSEYTLEEMLTYAMEDEYMAQAEYSQILDTYESQRPFSNIINAEAYHISLLEPLFDAYDVTIPAKDWNSLISVPASLEEAYAIGVEAEEKNIEMYQNFLKEELPEDVKTVFENLLNASERNLTAFTRQVDGTCIGNANGTQNGCANGTCNGIRNQSGRGMNTGGQGNQGASRGSCMTSA